MFNRRYFLQSSVLSSLGWLTAGKASAAPSSLPASAAKHTAPSSLPAAVAGSVPTATDPVPTPSPTDPPSLTDHPIVISTWDAGLAANKGAWDVLSRNGSALDAVEAGVKITEASQNCCVGLGANPDRDGYVTLDASIMDHEWNCGAVGFLERIKHPISVARRVMEKTPHVMLVGVGAQQFAVAEGFPLEPAALSDDAKKNYKKWLEKAEYKPVINIENHDTIGMVAMDAAGNLSGSCTTSGMGFKMRGRLGDSPIIGAGLFVDNEVGAVTATGQGEDVIRVCGSHSVVEFMRQGMSPEDACKAAVEKIARIKKEKAKDIQVAFIALNKRGEAGAYALQKGFTYALKNNKEERMVEVKSYF
jgi:N4-(beta-N-acetylglucosaminyl)-L-asparaginase